MANAPQFFSQVVVGLPAPPLSRCFGGSLIHKYCLPELADNGIDPAILSHGAPNADLTNYTVLSITGEHNLNTTYGDAHGTNNGCGISERSKVPTVSDPNSELVSTSLLTPAQRPIIRGSEKEEHDKKTMPNAANGAVTSCQSAGLIARI
jgi:hypothetical protein